jgi:hypothetical protein
VPSITQLPELISLAAEPVETTGSTSDKAPKRGRACPSGPSLKVPLTQSYPDGAIGEELVAAEFLGHLQAAIDVRRLDGEGRYVWIRDVALDCARATDRAISVWAVSTTQQPEAAMSPV